MTFKHHISNFYRSAILLPLILTLAACGGASDSPTLVNAQNETAGDTGGDTGNNGGTTGGNSTGGDDGGQTGSGSGDGGNGTDGGGDGAVVTPTTIQALGPQLINGETPNDDSTFWACLGLSSIDNGFYLPFRFFADQSGFLGLDEKSSYMVWQAQESSASFVLSGVNYRMDNVVFTDVYNFSTLLTGGASNNDDIDCELYNRNGTPVNPNRSDLLPTTTGTILNDLNGEGQEDMWICNTDNGGLISLYFETGGTGVIIDSTFERFSFNWQQSLSKEVNFSVYIDGNFVESKLSRTRFTSAHSFSSDAMLIGDIGFGNVNCRRYDLNQNPIL